MTQTTFTDNVFVDGSQDTNQLRVQGHSTQTQPLQSWENSAGAVLANVSADGRIQLGDDLGAATPDSMIEAHRADTSTTKPKRGFHSLGRISDTLANVAQWIVQEMEVRGSSALSALQTTLRVRAANMNTGTPVTGAEIRAGDFEVINDTTAGSAALPKATALQVAVTNAAGKSINQATGLYVKMTNAGTITTPYAIYTEGAGAVRLDDYIEVKSPTVVPSTPPTNYLRIYPKADGKLYAKNWNGLEYDLTAVGSDGGTVCNGRLTLTSGVPVTTADVTTAAMLYFTPFRGNQIALYSGSVWAVYSFTERSLSLNGLAANTNYDIFIYDNSGNLILEAVAWTNDTTRATALVLQDGVYVKNGAITRRYLGTIRTVAAGQTEDSQAKRFVWNYYARQPRRLLRTEPTDSWTYSTAVYRAANGSTSNRVEMVCGQIEDLISVEVFAVVTGTHPGANGMSISIGEDSVSTAHSDVLGCRIILAVAGDGGLGTASLNKPVSLGYHYYQWLESGSGLGTQTWYSNSPLLRSGIVGSVLA